MKRVYSHSSATPNDKRCAMVWESKHLKDGSVVLAFMCKYDNPHYDDPNPWNVKVHTPGKLYEFDYVTPNGELDPECKNWYSTREAARDALRKFKESVPHVKVIGGLH